MAYKDREKEKEHRKLYRLAHQEEIREKNRRYHAAYREQSLEKSRLYYATHQKELLEKARQKLVDNGGKIRQQRKQWREAHRDKRNEQSRVSYYKNREVRLEKQRRYNIIAKEKINEKLLRKRIMEPEKFREANRRWYKKHPERRHQDTLRKYNLTPIEYGLLLASQGGVCAICGEPEKAKGQGTEKIKRLAVDHSHDSGTVRGLLCTRCNVGLGLIESLGSEGLARIADYLARNEADRSAA